MRTFEGDSGLGLSTDTLLGNGGTGCLGDGGSKTCYPIKDD